MLRISAALVLFSSQGALLEQGQYKTVEEQNKVTNETDFLVNEIEILKKSVESLKHENTRLRNTDEILYNKLEMLLTLVGENHDVKESKDFPQENAGVSTMLKAKGSHFTKIWNNLERALPKFQSKTKSKY